MNEVGTFTELFSQNILTSVVSLELSSLFIDITYEALYKNYKENSFISSSERMNRDVVSSVLNIMTNY